MKKICAGIVFVCMACFLVAGTCVGGAGPCDRAGDPDQVRVRDGSCREAIQWKGDVQILLAADRVQDQKHDGLKDQDCDDCDDCDGEPDRIRDRAHDDEETLFLPEWIMI